MKRVRELRREASRRSEEIRESLPPARRPQGKTAAAEAAGSGTAGVLAPGHPPLPPSTDCDVHRRAQGGREGCGAVGPGFPTISSATVQALNERLPLPHRAGDG